MDKQDADGLPASEVGVVVSSPKFLSRITEAIGGDLAYRYGLSGSLAGIAFDKAQGVLASPQFGSAPQTLQPLATLQDGLTKLS